MIPVGLTAVRSEKSEAIQNKTFGAGKAAVTISNGEIKEKNKKKKHDKIALL